jgi:hypothetical protein
MVIDSGTRPIRPEVFCAMDVVPVPVRALRPGLQRGNDTPMLVEYFEAIAGEGAR